MKFGGTSVQDATAMKRAIQAVAARLQQSPIVVLSATAKTTGQLLELADKAHRGDVDGAHALRQAIEERHLDAAKGLLAGPRLDNTQFRLAECFGEIATIIQGLALLGEVTPRVKDRVASLGERMSSLIFADALAEAGYRAKLLDSRELIRTDDDFTKAVVLEDVSFPKLRRRIKPLLQEKKIPVLQGFIGSTLEGVATTIGRGGSDLSAALIGAALDVEDIQIWTDVPGILTTDPRIVPQAYKVTRISFKEASELAYFGAKVLHPSTLLPAISRNIPVHVCDSNHIERIGTLISSEPVPSRTPVKAIACKKGITLLNIHSTRMLLAYGFLRRIFEVFDRHRTAVDVVATSEVSVSVSLDSIERLPAILADLKAFSEVDVEPNVAIICTVGDDLRSTPGISGRIFKAVEKINVRMISQGASRINITFLVREERMEEAVRSLHEELFNDADPDVFEALG